MKFIADLKAGDKISDIYFCKHKTSAVTKNGKPYDNVILMDKTGTIDAKIWEPNSEGIDEFEAMDYVDIYGEVSSFNGALQVSIRRARYCREGEYDPALYMPMSSKNIDTMYEELLQLIDSVEDPHLHQLLNAFFRDNALFIKKFRTTSAAKTVHHAFIGGLLEHTLSVTKMCNYYSSAYPILNRDLLLTAAICHDIGKTRELSQFPENDYTDEGNFLGHIVMGAQMVAEEAANIPGFPLLLSQKLQHCILAHHGELEYGSPKKPSIIEAMALNMADNTDAKMETFTEILAGIKEPGWQGFNRFVDSNIYG